MLTYILASAYRQKIFATNSEKQADRAIISSAFFVSLFSTCSIFSFICLQQKGFAPRSIETVFPEVLLTIFPAGFCADRLCFSFDPFCDDAERFLERNAIDLVTRFFKYRMRLLPARDLLCRRFCSYLSSWRQFFSSTGLGTDDSCQRP